MAQGPMQSDRNKGAEGALSCFVGTSGGGHDLCYFVYLAFGGRGRRSAYIIK